MDFMQVGIAPAKAKAMERALQELRAKIVAGVLCPGEQIRQQEMAAEFGVSRVPLREALNVLADQGLVVHRPNSGYFVVKRAANEQHQIRRVLQLLENELMCSIEWPDANYLEGLRILNEQMRECLAGEDWTPLVRLNREFHLRIFALSPYGLILEEVKRLWLLADVFIANKVADVGRRRQTVLEHDVLLRCLSRRDRAACLEALEFHRTSASLDTSARLEGLKSFEVREAKIIEPANVRPL
jgi:DNA-binding GntR family transcriptional regulator